MGVSACKQGHALLPQRCLCCFDLVDQHGCSDSFQESAPRFEQPFSPSRRLHPPRAQARQQHQRPQRQLRPPSTRRPRLRRRRRRCADAAAAAAGAAASGRAARPQHAKQRKQRHGADAACARCGGRAAGGAAHGGVAHGRGTPVDGCRHGAHANKNCLCLHMHEDLHLNLGQCSACSRQQPCTAGCVPAVHGR